MSKSEDLSFFLRNFSRTLYLQGAISKDQVDDKELIKKLVLEGMNKSGGLYIVIDHREDMLRYANYFSEIGSKRMSIVMYAMYFEHAVNSLIVLTLEKNGIKNKTKNEILRSASLSAKLSWVLELLCLPAFNEEHKNFILRIADERNSFVHYKFNAVHENEDRNKEADIILGKVKKTVRYMKNYSTRIEYKGKKYEIESSLSKI